MFMLFFFFSSRRRNTRCALFTGVQTVALPIYAHVSNNSVAISDIPRVIRSGHEALSALGATAVPEVKQEPAVSIRSSVKPDYIVCLEDGKKLKMLRRGYLSAGSC